MSVCLAAAYSHTRVLSHLLTKSHDTAALMGDRKFVIDLMLCGKATGNAAVQEFILCSAAPIETAVKARPCPPRVQGWGE